MTLKNENIYILYSFIQNIESYELVYERRLLRLLRLVCFLLDRLRRAVLRPPSAVGLGSSGNTKLVGSSVSDRGRTLPAPSFAEARPANDGADNPGVGLPAPPFAGAGSAPIREGTRIEAATDGTVGTGEDLLPPPPGATEAVGKG
jgi:hypothetical protein